MKQYWASKFDSRFAKIGLVLVVVQTIVTVSIEVSILTKNLNRINLPKLFFYYSADKSSFVFPVMYIIAMLFSAYLFLDAVVQRNTMQLISFLLFQIFNIVWGVLNYFVLINSNWNTVDAEIFQPVKPSTIALPVILSATAIAWAYIVYKLYLEFGWDMYKRIGANLHIREIYKEYLILVQLLKLNYFVITAFAFQYIFLILKSNDSEYPITIAFVPVSLSILIISYYALKRESVVLMWIFIVGLVVFVGYYVFKLVRMYDPLQKTKYDKIKTITTYFAGVSLTLILSTVFQAIICLTNFNQGLSKQIELIEGSSSDSLLGGPRFYINSAGQRRMALEEYN